MKPCVFPSHTAVCLPHFICPASTEAPEINSTNALTTTVPEVSGLLTPQSFKTPHLATSDTWTMPTTTNESTSVSALDDPAQTSYFSDDTNQPASQSLTTNIVDAPTNMSVTSTRTTPQGSVITAHSIPQLSATYPILTDTSTHTFQDRMQTEESHLTSDEMVMLINSSSSTSEGSIEESLSITPMVTAREMTTTKKATSTDKVNTVSG